MLVSIDLRDYCRYILPIYSYYYFSYTSYSKYEYFRSKYLYLFQTNLYFLINEFVLFDFMISYTFKKKKHFNYLFFPSAPRACSAFPRITSRYNCY